jgi:hypothetical protein
VCDTIVVVTPHGVGFAKNSDRAANEAQVLDWQPAREHPPRGVVRCTWLTIPQVRRTHAVLLSRPFWQWGAEMAANEHGVLIGNEAVFTRAAVPARGLTGMDLLRLGVERADTAERAAAVIIDLIAQHGQGGGCDHEQAGFAYFSSFLIADRRRAFVLETAGREHAVQEVVGARTISNGLSIPGFAESRRDGLKTWAAQARDRRALTQAAAQAVRTVADLLPLLRAHGPAGPGAAAAPVTYSWLNGAMGGPCMHAGGLAAAAQTVASWAAWLSPAGDAHWVTGTAAPCTGLFKPVAVTQRLPTALLGAEPTDRADPTSLFWRHERLHRAVLAAETELRPLLIPERDAIEAQWLRQPPPPAEAFARGNELLARWSAQVSERLRQLDGRQARRPWYLERYWRTRNQWAGLEPGVMRSLRRPRPSEP